LKIGLETAAIESLFGLIEKEKFDCLSGSFCIFRTIQISPK